MAGGDVLGLSGDLEIAVCGLRIADCGLRIGIADCDLRIATADLRLRNTGCVLHARLRTANNGVLNPL